MKYCSRFTPTVAEQEEPSESSDNLPTQMLEALFAWSPVSS
jgi:hypothetical protein